MSFSSLSSRERVRLALAHQETDRIPIAMVCAGINPPAYEELAAYLQRERGLTVEEYLEPLLDIIGVGPAYIGPELPAGYNEWGVGSAPISYGAASYDEIYHHPLASVENPADLEHHSWPTTTMYDYTVLPARISAAQTQREMCVIVSNGNIFETSWYMRGLERMLEDLVVNPELAWAIMERVTDFYLAHFTEMLTVAKGEIDLVFTADDIGTQQGLLLALPMWERLIKPHHARLNARIHELGAKVIYHSDGAVMEAVPGLIDMGIDILQALQFSAAGMDPGLLKERYGDRLCFEGGISVQTTLPFGTPEEVRQEVELLIRVLGKNGGYILGPSHAIQAGTPPANIVAAFDTAKSYY